MKEGRKDVDSDTPFGAEAHGIQWLIDQNGRGKALSTKNHIF